MAWSLQGTTAERACSNVHIAHFTLCLLFFPSQREGDKEGFISPLNQILQRTRSSLPFCSATGKAEVIDVAGKEYDVLESVWTLDKLK